MMKALSGNEAIAEAMRQINPHVVAAYPITPQTDATEKFAQFVNDGKVDSKLIKIESEHSAMSACVGAAAAGSRTMTASNSQGLALMSEICWIAAGLRLPITMAIMNRALSAPINIHCDHSDSMGVRDSGWIQLYGENAQEGYDNLIQSVKIAESAQLPVISAIDGFITSHSVEQVNLLKSKEVKEFIGSFEPEDSLLDLKNPITYNPIDLFDYYFEHKRQQAEAMQKASKIIKKVGNQFSSISGRNYGFFDEISLKDAELAIVVMGSAAGTARIVVNELREKGKKVGLLKLRSFRPFPSNQIVKALKPIKKIAVLDRACSWGSGGPLYTELRSAFYENPEPEIYGYIYGLGGRDLRKVHLTKVFADLAKMPKKRIQYLGVRNES